MIRADTFERIYNDLSGTYVPGTLNWLEENHGDLWKQIINKEDEINENWTLITYVQFVFMCNSLKRLLLKGIMLRRKCV